jgi:hypothetical protein
MSIEPQAELAAVMAQYGAAMLEVQAFEAALAALVGVLDIKPGTGDEPARSPRAVERSLRRVIKHNWHLFNTASASEATRNLEGRIETGLLDDISALLGWRDFLAHRYFRTRLGTTLEGVDVTGLVLELYELGRAFGEVRARIMTAVQDALSLGELAAVQRSAANMPPGVVEVLKAVARATVTAQPDRFRRPGQSPVPPPPPGDEEDDRETVD